MQKTLLIRISESLKSKFKLIVDLQNDIGNSSHLMTKEAMLS